MKKGDIVLVAFPFSDGPVKKLRPAVVLVSEDGYGDVCLSFVTSRLQRRSEFCIVLQTTAKSGLKAPSMVQLNKIVTLHRDHIQGQIGTVGMAEIQSIDAMLLEMFQL
ncbi:MAG: hypothetical protein A2666_05655 [Parcubacteria group bacterium RIFCSPHIGHO2_01_FULL_47_10b]|nr:MAG: hypothetical protein A2666_05655 [Parcubacteria group bacterium RIFCSPHIGHO2_01_FULL_47_10b]QBM02302.1 hypothetical protein [uncultured archaeon]